MSNIRLEFDVQASVDAVYTALTQESGVKSWWTTDTDLQASEGSDARFGFGSQGEFKMKVSKLNKNQHVKWDVIQAAPDWVDTYVTFDLEANGDGTKIHFAHSNFATEDGSFASVTFNWAYFMMSLKAYLETGEGTPVPA